MIFSYWNPIEYAAQVEANRRLAAQRLSEQKAAYADMLHAWNVAQADIIDIAPEDVRFVEDPKLIEAKK